MIKFPIYNKNNELLLYTLVDKSSLKKMSQYTWRHMGRGYIKSKDKMSKDQYLHRFVMGMPPSHIIVDHIDGNHYNNTKRNLRLVTQQENSMNRSKINKSTTSRYKGVYFNGKKYTVLISRGDIKVNMGSFDDEKEAAEMYNKAAKKLFGKFARLNVITK